MNIERDTGRVYSLKIERIGERPTAAFMAGIHGDEGSIIPPLREIMKALSEHLEKPIGDHIHCLEAHPEALVQKSRVVDGIDVNREFGLTTNPDHPHASRLATVIHNHPDLHTLFTFHEDTEDDRFYFYYQPPTREFGEQDRVVYELRDRLLEKVQALGIGLYNDIDDPTLGNMVVNGFSLCPADGVHDGTFEMWAVNKTYVNHPNLTRAFAFEIPGKLSHEKKIEILAVVFTDFIVPYLALR